MDYKPLERYGVIGNLETSALVGDDGSIDWYCAPHVESPSLFARLLDAERGGHFAVRPSESFRSHQRYVDDTNVLQTRFGTARGEVTVTDFMPVAERTYRRPVPGHTIYRRLSVDRSRSNLEVEFAPAFGYASEVPAFEVTEDGAVARGEDVEATILGLRPSSIERHGVTGTVSLAAGESAWLVVTLGEEEAVRGSDHDAILDETIRYWRDWTHNCRNEEKCHLRGPWHDYAVRSGLVLKVLTHHVTGAIAAAPTTSLPEEIGGARNWDYRYNWLRDAAFTTQALYKLGHRREAMEYLAWLHERCRATAPDRMQPLYGLHGEADLIERELDHLDGYRGSRPVRVGNAAAGQLQLDIYGELVDAVYETTRHGRDLPEEDWEAIRDVIDYVCDVWTRRDAGIWEVRSEPQHFVYSKVMCWVALDRGLKLVESTGFDGPVDRWTEMSEEIRRAVLEEGYDDSLESFVRSFESETALDATGVLIPVRGFLPFHDPRIQGTIDRSLERLATDEGFVYRYEGEDGVVGGEGAFLLCSFWLVNALALSGRVERAVELFGKVLNYVSPLGLLAEEIDPESGEQLGNFPQAFSHIGLVNSVLYLNRARGVRHPGPELHGVEASTFVPDLEH